jgi:hypothetical protein
MKETRLGSWSDYRHGDYNVRATVKWVVGDEADDVDLARVEDDYRTALAMALPQGVQLRGRTFYGRPGMSIEEQAEAAMDIRTALETVSMEPLIEQCRTRR